MTEDAWDNLYYFFDMITGGLQRHIAQGDLWDKAEVYETRFNQEYGENNPHQVAIWEIIFLNISEINKIDFAKFLLDIHHHLVPMFVSFLKSSKNKRKNISSSYTKNALMDYFKSITPKRRI